MNNIYITNKKGADIEKGVFGLFFEDINYAADGGIMAEMIENYSFEFYNSEPQFDYGWSVTGEGVGFEITNEIPMNENNTHCAKIKTSKPMEGIKNKCYDGVFLKKGDVCIVSLYGQIKENNIYFSVEKNGKCFGSVKLEKTDEKAVCVNDGWVKYTGEITLLEDIKGGNAVIRLERAGEAFVDMVSMVKSDAVMGLFRRDIVEVLGMMKPAFLRFPGGCAVEGGCDLSTAYAWKETVGEKEGRKLKRSRWQNGEAKFYCQSYNLGFYEYFLLCEYLNAQAVPVLNVGLACMVNENPEGVPVYKEKGKTYKTATENDLTDEFKKYIDDMIDLVEFANGTDFENSYYANLRKRMGHEAPFNLKFIGLGNEQWERGGSLWHDRYFWAEHFLHKKDKNLKLISSAAWFHTGNEYHTNEYSFNRIMLSENPNFTYALDEHYYETPDWFYENIDYYDKYRRDINVFLGEVSARWEKKPGDYTICTLENAIAEAAYFTMTERNSDIVKMISAAPLLCRVGGEKYSQWSPNMIWYDAESVFLTPSYYVQLMYAQNSGNYNLTTKVNGEKIYANTVFDNLTGDIIIKIVNASDNRKTVVINVDPDISFKSSRAKVTVLTGGKNDYNSIANPKNVAPVTYEERIEHCTKKELLPNSFTVMRICTEHMLQNGMF